jgi:hypothetical protein
MLRKSKKVFKFIIKNLTFEYFETSIDLNLFVFSLLLFILINLYHPSSALLNFV